MTNQNNDEIQVILMKCKSFTDGKNKFKQGTPISMSVEAAKRYKGNALFAVRTVKQQKAVKPGLAKSTNPASLENDEDIEQPKTKQEENTKSHSFLKKLKIKNDD